MVSYVKLSDSTFIYSSGAGGETSGRWDISEDGKYLIIHSAPAKDSLEQLLIVNRKLKIKNKNVLYDEKSNWIYKRVN